MSCLLSHVKDGGLRKKEIGGFSFGVDSSSEKKKVGARIVGKGKRTLLGQEGVGWLVRVGACKLRLRRDQGRS